MRPLKIQFRGLVTLVSYSATHLPVFIAKFRFSKGSSPLCDLVVGRPPVAVAAGRGRIGAAVGGQTTARQAQGIGDRGLHGVILRLFLEF